MKQIGLTSRTSASTVTTTTATTSRSGSSIVVAPGPTRMQPPPPVVPATPVTPPVTPIAIPQAQVLSAAELSAFKAKYKYNFNYLVDRIAWNLKLRTAFQMGDFDIDEFGFMVDQDKSGQDVNMYGTHSSVALLAPGLSTPLKPYGNPASAIERGIWNAILHKPFRRGDFDINDYGYMVDQDKSGQYVDQCGTHLAEPRLVPGLNAPLIIDPVVPTVIPSVTNGTVGTGTRTTRLEVDPREATRNDTVANGTRTEGDGTTRGGTDNTAETADTSITVKDTNASNASLGGTTILLVIGASVLFSMFSKK